MDIKLDLTFAQVVADQIEDYLYAETLYYPVKAMNGMEMPQLTIGNWLETQWRLGAAARTPEGQSLNVASALGKIQGEVHRLRMQFQEPYQNKSRREFRSRIDTWELWLADQKNYINSDQALNTGAAYTAQVHVRLKLDLLQDDVPQQPAQQLRLRMADETLQRRFRSGAFVWEPELAAAAPKVKWWWLWGA